jgi:1,4-alpha-glucan branching enzyme
MDELISARFPKEKRMHVVILTWEYPPRIVGEIAIHTHKLAVGLVKQGVEVDVVTYHDQIVGCENVEGVKVHRVFNPIKDSVHILTWSMTLNEEFVRVVSDICHSSGGIDLMDAHEWLCVPAAVSLSKSFGIPWVFSVHSLENHRSRGSDYPINQSIKSVERQGFHEANKIVVNSGWMAREVIRIYNVPSRRINVVSPKSVTWVADVLKAYGEATASERSLSTPL